MYDHKASGHRAHVLAAPEAHRNKKVYDTDNKHGQPIQTQRKHKPVG